MTIVAVRSSPTSCYVVCIVVCIVMCIVVPGDASKLKVKRRGCTTLYIAG